MKTDKVYFMRLKEYSKGFLDYIEVELENCGLGYSDYNILKIFNVIQFDEIEKYLFYKYGIEFAQALSELLKNR